MKYLSCEDRLAELDLFNLEKTLGRPYNILPAPKGGSVRKMGTHILAGSVAIGQGIMALK